MDSNERIKEEIKKALPALKRFAKSQGNKHISDFEDLVQDTLEYALRNSSQYQVGSDMGKWLVAICYNLTRNMVRVERTRNKYMINDNDADTPELPHQHDALLFSEARKLVENLPIEQRAVFYLVCYDGKTYKEAAEILNLNVGTVKSRISRARADILAALDMDETRSTQSTIKREPSM